MQKQSNCVQVVMGYGHNKLSLEEAEELLKEVNHSQQQQNLILMITKGRQTRVIKGRGWGVEIETVNDGSGGLQ